MKILLFPPGTTLDGPWLLSSKSLRELDTILNEYWKKFESRRLRLLRIAIRKQIELYEPVSDIRMVKNQIDNFKENSLFAQWSKSLIIEIGDEPAVPCDSFEKALKDRYLLDKRPTGFTIDMTSGDLEFFMSVDKSKNLMEITTKPINEDLAQEFYTAVYRWAREIRFNAMGQWLWGKVAKLKWMIIMFYFSISAVSVLTTQTTDSTSIKNQLFALYDQGITNSNVVEAVRLLVLLEQGGQLSSFLSGMVATPWLLASLIIITYVLVVLSIRPKVELDIGKGSDAILGWKIWQWLISLPPLFVALDVLSPYLAELIRDFLSLIS